MSEPLTPFILAVNILPFLEVSAVWPLRQVCKTWKDAVESDYFFPTISVDLRLTQLQEKFLPRAAHLSGTAVSPNAAVSYLRASQETVQTVDLAIFGLPRRIEPFNAVRVSPIRLSNYDERAEAAMPFGEVGEVGEVGKKERQTTVSQYFGFQRLTSLMLRGFSSIEVLCQFQESLDYEQPCSSKTSYQGRESPKSCCRLPALKRLVVRASNNFPIKRCSLWEFIKRLPPEMDEVSILCPETADARDFWDTALSHLHSSIALFHYSVFHPSFLELFRYPSATTFFHTIHVGDCKDLDALEDLLHAIDRFSIRRGVHRTIVRLASVRIDLSSSVNALRHLRKRLSRLLPRIQIENALKFNFPQETGSRHNTYSRSPVITPVGEYGDTPTPPHIHEESEVANVTYFPKFHLDETCRHRVSFRRCSSFKGTENHCECDVRNCGPPLDFLQMDMTVDQFLKHYIPSLNNEYHELDEETARLKYSCICHALSAEDGIDQRTWNRGTSRDTREFSSLFNRIGDEARYLSGYSTDQAKTSSCSIQPREDVAASLKPIFAVASVSTIDTEDNSVMHKTDPIGEGTSVDPDNCCCTTFPEDSMKHTTRNNGRIWTWSAEEEVPFWPNKVSGFTIESTSQHQLAPATTILAEVEKPETHQLSCPLRRMSALTLLRYAVGGKLEFPAVPRVEFSGFHPASFPAQIALLNLLNVNWQRHNNCLLETSAIRHVTTRRSLNRLFLWRTRISPSEDTVNSFPKSLRHWEVVAAAFARHKDFKDNFFALDGEYYEAAQMKMMSTAFQRFCPTAVFSQL